MQKKIISVILSLVMLLSCAAALSEEVPSPAAQTSVTSSVVVTEDGTVLENVEITLNSESEAAAGVATELAALAASESPEAVTEYFGEEAVNQAAELLGEENAKNLAVAEVVSITLPSDQEINQAITVGFDFQADYEDGTPMVAMISDPSKPESEWIAVEASVVDGTVMITLTPEAIAQIQGSGDAVMVLMVAETEEAAAE